MTGPAAGDTAAAGGLSITVDVLSAALVKLYADAEQALVGELATIAGRAAAEAGVTARLVMLNQMRQAAVRIATALAARAEPLTSQIMREAAQRGDAAALDLLRRTVAGDPRLIRLYLARTGDMTGHGVAAANAIGLELAGKLDTARAGILRAADDAYRAVVADAATRLVLGNEDLTPHTAQRLAFRRFTEQAVPRFVDQSGRRWSMASYSEMAVRTAVQRAYNASHEARMTAVGIRYFTISHDGHPCPQCKPWEGAVLSHGRVGPVVEAAADTGRPVAFKVDGTLEQARAAGLQHPNCRHVLLPYLPGVTKTTGAREWTKADQARYDATQTLRYYERQIRAAKQAQQIAAGLGNEQQVRAARAQQRRYQAHIRDLVATTGLVRRRRREQLDLGL